MSILWADNFQMYGVTEALMLNGLYAYLQNPVLQPDPDPSGTGETVIGFGPGGGNISLPYPGNGFRCTVPGASKNTVGMSMRYYVSALPELDMVRLQLFTCIGTGGQRNLTLVLRTDGRLSFCVGSANPNGVNNFSGGILATSSLPVITANAWHHIEMKVTISATVGATEVRVNGAEVIGLTLSNVDTWQSGDVNIGSISVESNDYIADGPYMWVKDFILWDTNGTQNNNFLGTNGVYNLIPDSDASLTWTASTGLDGFDLVNDATVNDTTYISAADPPPARNEFGLSDLPPDIVSIKGIVSVVRAKKIDGGDGNIQAGVKGTLVDSGSNRPLTTAFTYWFDVYELSPDTGVSWTPVEVNNAKLTLDRTV
jgi:hypothetical protein